jgi:lipopolysaccharide export system permease protein
MNLIDRYIFKQFLWNFILVVGGLLSLYILIDFFEKIDNFTEKGKTVGYALQFFMLKIPDIYFQVSPVCILLAGIITLGILNQNKEAIALNAGGISFVRIIIPITLSSLIITMATMAMSQWILPTTSTRANEIWEGEIRNRQTEGIIRNKNVFFHGKEGIYTFSNSNDHTVLKNFLYTSWDEDRNLTLFISAETASFDKRWTLVNGIKKTKTPTSDFSIINFDTLTLDLNESPADFFTPTFRPGEHSISELWTRTSDGLGRSPAMLLDLHSRLSFIFLGIPLLLFAIPITTHIHHKWKRDLTVAIPFSCALAFMVWGIWSALQAMAKLSIISPLAGSWCVHILASIIAFIWIGRQNSHGA